MYDFEFIDKEELIDIFDNVLVIQNDKEKFTTIALTNKRLLFLDYIDINDGMEALRITGRLSLVRKKEVYYNVNLEDIDFVLNEEFYTVKLINGYSFCFDDDRLYELLIDYIKK